MESSPIVFKIDRLSYHKKLTVDFPGVGYDPVVANGTPFNIAWRHYTSAKKTQDAVNINGWGQIIQAHLEVNRNTPPENIINDPRIPQDSDLYKKAKSVIDQREVDLRRQAEFESQFRISRRKGHYRICRAAIVGVGLFVGVNLIIRTKKFDDFLHRVLHRRT